MITNSQTNSCGRGLVDISGLCNPSDTTDLLRVYPYWKQMYISESLVIPDVKPDIEQINSVVASVTILSKKVIVTPRSYNDAVTPPVPLPNLEGKLLTGRTLIVEGQLCQQIEYTANEPSQPVHSVHFYVPFTSAIVVPLEVTLTNAAGTVTLDSLDVEFEVNACLEDVTACILDERRIQKQVTLLISAVPSLTC